MASADFCLNNQSITELTAVDFHPIRSTLDDGIQRAKTFSNPAPFTGFLSTAC
ncbi:MAG: hypothetical protein Q9M50_06575 [Methylococcales bacterium]|nr:hypothetical protein [Methylococcales bacterium]